MTVSGHEDKVRQLEETNQNYQDAIEFINHELKNKLISIIGPLKSLMASEKDEDKKKKLISIYDQVKSLEDMSAHFLLFSQLKENSIPVHCEEIENLYNDIIMPVIRNLPENASLAMAESMKKIAEQEPIKLHADKHLLKACFENLFGNAVKYRDPDSEISFNAQDIGPRYQFNIMNKGPGVPYEDADKIFEKFYRSQSAANQCSKGTGIGLYNTRQIIQAHGGAIWCETEPGKWINFIFTIPKQ